jgi:prepilin-type N-terminal cleavage/methylation domain-containing protein
MNPANPAVAGGYRVGFNLVELLVATSIIAILVALLLPALARSREQSRKVSCQGVLHQVYLLTRMYADDHEGAMPLRSVLFPTGQFPGCPSKSDSAADLNSGGYSWIYYYVQQG